MCNKVFICWILLLTTKKAYNNYRLKTIKLSDYQTIITVFVFFVIYKKKK